MCIQVADEITKIGRTKRYGTAGVRRPAIDRQIRSLRNGIQVVIGTPGRLLDHIRRQTISLDHVKFLVLDEADEMLDMGFVDDMEEIIKTFPRNARPCCSLLPCPGPF